MSLPANDAFTLALSHSDSPSRRSSRSRSLTRSPSPKIAFAAPAADAKRRTSTRHRVSKGGVEGVGRESVKEETLQEISEADDALELERRRPNSKATEEDRKDRKIDWEIPRKVLHSSIGFLTLWIYASDGSTQRVVVTLTGILCIAVPTDVLRLNSPAFERYYERCLGFLMRESEKKSSNGVIWYILGVLFVLTLYPLDIAVMSIVILSWADTAASTFGRLWGRYTPPLPARLLGLPLAPRKSLAGFVAASLTGAAITVAFWATFGYHDVRSSWDWQAGVIRAGLDNSELGSAVRRTLRVVGWEGVNTAGWTGLAAVGAVAGLVTAIAEALDLGSLDDNLTLPIISGGAIWGFLKLLSWFSS